MAWIVTEGNEYADVHSNSGEFTYGGNDSLCGGIPENTCDPYTNYTVKAELEESSGFDPFNSEYKCGNISKTITAKSCNQDMLVMWFNSGDNKSYDSVLDNNTIFDIKNVDDCEHIVIAMDADGINPNSLRIGNQKFDDSGYTDSGYPCISTDPCGSSGECKYVSGTTYQGHKIKYHTINDTIPANFYVNHDELVELYFPHMYLSTDEGMNIKYIKQAAFKNCHRLSAITFSQVEEIESEAFAMCYGLEKIDWGHVDCCTSNLRKIGTSGFTNCSGLTELCLDKLVKIETIGAYGFYGCNHLETLSLPTASTYTKIEESCFEGCDKLGLVNIPSNIKEIESRAFYRLGQNRYPSNYPNVIIPNSVKTIGDSAFGGHLSSGINVYVSWGWSTDAQHNVTLLDSSGNAISLATNCFGGETTNLYVPSEVDKTAYELYINDKGMQGITVHVGTP